MWLLGFQGLILLYPVEIGSLVSQDVFVSQLVLWHLYGHANTVVGTECRKSISGSYSYRHIN